MASRAANLHRSFRPRLTKWYLHHRRDLPWRPAPGRPANPYHVLVSEAMLQQTQVATVLPYFERFIAAFPTVEALAGADLQAVLRLWQGLGYYRRARHLHAAAQRIVADLGGMVPRSPEALLTLPGVGRYSAGAVASIAYDVPAPILDGNVARVLARVFAIDTPVDATATRRRLWDLATALVPRRGAGDFNQAMMEMGATVCLPRQPRCSACPLQGLCQAQVRGLTDRLPVASPRRAAKAIRHDIVAVRCGGRYLFEQRPATGLWAGLWQLPTREEAGLTLDAWLGQRLRLDTGSLQRVGEFTHQLTHRTVTFVLWTAGLPRRQRGTWRTLEAVDDLPLANPQRRAIAMLRQAAATA